MKTSDFDYELPPEYIAQTPVEPRDSSKLMVLERASGQITHQIQFRDLGDLLNPGDLVVINQTRVIPARLFARKIPTGGKVELLLLKRLEPQIWECLVGGKGMVVGKGVQLVDGPAAEVIAELGGSRRLIRFAEPLRMVLDNIGQIPLPPYIHEKLSEPERYQTVYAQQAGSAAAPTAGLHFTPDLIAQLKNQGVNFAPVTLHVGLDTFAPVNEANPQEHEIHTEWCQLSPETADIIEQTKHAGGRVIAVGTTSTRTLESAAALATGNSQLITPFEGPTDLFILPGYEFKIVDAMITNFHLPKSTLIMLVSAFLGRANTLAAYEAAKQEQYRFYSFGDAMVIC
jgi:S-adenosylmethionine:tRNA ribosyltransferase-isomerase